MTKKNFMRFGKNPKQTRLLAVLLLVLVAGGLIYWRYYSSNPPRALDSSADETRAHWSHGTIPFQLPIINKASGNWRQPLGVAAGKWGQANMVNYKIVKEPQDRTCYMFAEGMRFCSYSAQDGYVIGATYVQAPNNPHIIGAMIRVNDAYLNTRNQIYSTDAWRNYFVCYYLGWTLGVNSRFYDAPEDMSCMSWSIDSTSLANRQSPDEMDYSDLRTLYNHIDDNSSSAVGYKIDSANKFVEKNQYGAVIGSSEDGLQQVYEQDLGDGYRMVTLRQKMPTKK